MKKQANKEHEQHAKQIFDTGYTAEEFVARFTHKFGCSSFDEYTYDDKKLQELIYQIHRYWFFEREKIDEFRKKYLTDEEYENVIEEENDF